MKEEIEKRLLELCFGVLKALSYLLVKNGIGYRALEETAKQAYVEAIRDNFGVQGRKTNVSRVCAMSGMSRKEVNRILEAKEAGRLGVETMKRSGKLGVVMARWYSDANYITDSFQPRVLRLDGKGYTFTRLVRSVGLGDSTTTALLKELIRVGCVVEEKDGKYRAISATYIPLSDDPKLIDVAGDALRQMSWTVVQNLVTKDLDKRFLQRRVYSEDLPKADRELFRHAAERDGQRLLERLNEWATEREYETRAKRGRELKRKEKKVPVVGMGIYYFDSSYEEGKKE